MMAYGFGGVPAGPGIDPNVMFMGNGAPAWGAMPRVARPRRTAAATRSGAASGAPKASKKAQVKETGTKMLPHTSKTPVR